MKKLAYWSGNDLSKLEEEYDYKKDENVLYDTLTPPTANEVCEALSEWGKNNFNTKRIRCYLSR